MCQAKPTITRSLPTRSCKTKISYEDKNSSDDEKEANLNESAKNSTQNEVNDTTEENNEKKEDTTKVWNEQNVLHQSKHAIGRYKYLYLYTYYL